MANDAPPQPPPRPPPRVSLVPRPVRYTMPGRMSDVQAITPPPRPPPRSVSMPIRPPADALGLDSLEKLHRPRRQNDYVETRPLAAKMALRYKAKTETKNNNVDKADLKLVKSQKETQTLLPNSSSSAVTLQPRSFTKSKERSRVSSSDSELSSEHEESSIICSDCGRCRCVACTSPRPLPQSSCCGGTCVCSADNLVEYCSCACCAQALFYHCCAGDSSETEDKLCSCSGSHRVLRWTGLGLLSLIIPCLLCYWPLRGIAKACGKCYAWKHRKGCHCHRRTLPKAPPHIQKRLLEQQLQQS